MALIESARLLPSLTLTTPSAAHAFRFPVTDQRVVACIANLTPVVRHHHRVGLPRPGRWVEILNTDSTQFGGSGVTVGDFTAEAIGWNDLPYSASMTLPH